MSDYHSIFPLEILLRITINKSGSLGRNKPVANKPHQKRKARMNGKLPHLQIPLALKTLEGKRGPKEKIRDVS